jgi:hypothetical protein
MTKFSKNIFKTQIFRWLAIDGDKIVFQNDEFVEISDWNVVKITYLWVGN